jgi:hypothetical protein
LLADRAFDADWLRNDRLEREIITVIAPKSNRKRPATSDKETYKWRHLIENYFGKLWPAAGFVDTERRCW